MARLRRWWQAVGQVADAPARRRLIGAEGGGRNGYRRRLWKVARQRWATETGLAVTVCPLPPGTSKWNTSEHRLFAQISTTWRGRPLVRQEVSVALIGATTTATGRRVQAARNPGTYPTTVKVSDAEMAALHLTPHPCHGAWNDSIAP